MTQQPFSSLAMHENLSSSSLGKPYLLADIGEGIKEVEVLQWFVQAGDQVQEFDRVCEVQSDKATVEITARYAGIIEELACQQGEMLQVGEPLLFMKADEKEEESQRPTNIPPVLHNSASSDLLQIPQVASQFQLDSDTFTDVVVNGSTAAADAAGAAPKILASPAVRKWGRDHQLDLSRIVGTGPKGRILKADLLTFLQERGLRPSPEEAIQVSPTTQNNEGRPISMTPVHTQEENETHILKGYNRLMIQSMTAALEIPHMGFTDEFDLTNLIKYRKDINQGGHTKISILAFFIKAISLSLKEYPILNASWQDIENGKVTLWSNHNIGVAMDTPRGLVVPVIHTCQTKSLLEIQKDLDALKERASSGKLEQADLKDATFSLSNIGAIGGTYMKPIVVTPQAAIGAMGKIQTLPRFDSENLVQPAQIMAMSWSGDHRMVDGATLARFSNLCKSYLENPMLMLTAMK